MVGAAVGPLRRDAGQARDRFADRGPAACRCPRPRPTRRSAPGSSWSDRALEAAAEAGDDDRVVLGRGGRGGVVAGFLGGSAGRARPRAACSAPGPAWRSARGTAPAGSRQAKRRLLMKDVMVSSPLLSAHANPNSTCPRHEVETYQSFAGEQNERPAIHTYSARYTVAAMTQRRPTSFDIAALAGVSQPTVSRALSGNPAVSAETRARVSPPPSSSTTRSTRTPRACAASTAAPWRCCSSRIRPPTRR
jgi:hypothetical protein